MEASVEIYLDGEFLFYSYNKSKFGENLYYVSKLMEAEVKAVQEGTKTKEQFIEDYKEEVDIKKRRKQARHILGVDEDSLNLEEINKKYKLLAKDHHPDRDGGSTEKFKEINNAHKLLKKELA